MSQDKHTGGTNMTSEGSETAKGEFKSPSGVEDKTLQELRYLLADLQFNDEPGIDGSLGGNMESEYFEAMLDTIASHTKALEIKARISELKKTHKCIDDTYMILTNDLPSLLMQEDVYKTRKQHKAELHKNIDARISALQAEQEKQ